MSRSRAASIFFTAVALLISCGSDLRADSASAADQPTQADTTPPPPDHTLLGRLEAAGIVVRQSFVGVKEENLPASLNYVDSTLSGRSVNLDLAVKQKGFEWDPQANQTLLVSPSIEWHRSTATAMPTDKVSGAANLEYFVGTGGVGNGLVSQGKASVTRDVVKNQTQETASLLLTLRHMNGPGDKLSFLGYGFFYPYVGFEYFRNLPLQQGTVTVAPAVNLSFVTERLYLELYPFNSDPKGPRRLQLLGTYTYRERVAGDQAAARAYGLLELTVLYYLDSALRSAIAYSFEDGHNPLNNFLHDRKSSIAFKLKLGS
jgi:hypothetical protein